MDLVPLVQEQTQSPAWGSFALRILNELGGPKPHNGTQSDEAHPPIHPTKYAGDLAGQQKNVYEVCFYFDLSLEFISQVVTRSFLACVSKDATGQETVVTIGIVLEEVCICVLVTAN